MKQFTAMCNFGNTTAPVVFCIGSPKPENHPIQFQTNWLSSEKGGSVNPALMNSLKKLFEISQKNNTSFEELCYYAMTSAMKNNQKKAVK